MTPPTPTFNQKVRETQGDRVLTQRQEAMDRIANNWTPEYEAAERIKDTPTLWLEYRDQQVAFVDKQGNKQLRETMRMLLVDTTNADDRRLRQVLRSGRPNRESAVANRGHEHVHPVLPEPVRLQVDTKYDNPHLHIT